jgi:hypothetical protein
MNTYVILFVVCILGFAWRWHNQPASRQRDPFESKNVHTANS